MVEQERIDAIKRSVDLKALIESKGISLKQNGKGYVGLCPFHDDTNPSLSVNTKTNLWQCFGCKAGGDAITFVELFDKVDFKEAVNRLSGSSSIINPEWENGERTTVNKPPVRNVRLLNRVIEFYHTAFVEDTRAKQYLNKRGITDNSVLADFKVGFANGTLLNVLPPEGDLIKELQQTGILNDKGTEHFYGCVTFALYDLEGNPVGMYGRRVSALFADGPEHLYLPGKREGLINREAAKAHKHIILTESVIDAFTLIGSGIKNVIPCYGTNGLLADHKELFTRHKVEKVSICFDADESGNKAARTAAKELAAMDITAHIVRLPEGQDVNGFFLLTANASQRFKELLAPAGPESKQSPPKPKERFTVTDYGFYLHREGRTYEVRGIVKQQGKLKATIKGIKQEGSKGRMHVDTVDLYSARSRAFLIRGLVDLFGEEEAVIADDVQTLLTSAESYQPAEAKEESTQEEMSEEDKAQALAFLKNPDMFTEILADFETIGYTGEEMNKLLCYIAAVSRKMESPLSVMIQSRSAAGKSFLQDTVLSLIPEDDYTKYTRLTDQALFYKGKDSLKHKILAIEELDGMNGAIYSIRSIQSSKKITIAYTGKDAVTGELKAHENTVEGPLMVFITTTQVDIDGETASRFVFISIDESEDMTRKILAKQRHSYTMEGMIDKLKADEIAKKHHNANKLLKPLLVFNPYADLLSFTSKSLRVRRDHTKYLNLIAAIAYLFQYRRTVKTLTVNGKTAEYINVHLADIKKANEIANEVLGRSLDELTPPSKNLLKLIREMVLERSKQQKTKAHEYRFNRRQIREYSGWSDFQIKTHIKQLEELEYVYAVMGRKGKEYVYELVVTEEVVDNTPFLVGLVDVGRLKEKASQLGIKDE